MLWPVTWTGAGASSSRLWFSAWRRTVKVSRPACLRCSGEEQFGQIAVTAFVEHAAQRQAGAGLAGQGLHVLPDALRQRVGVASAAACVQCWSVR